MPTETKNKRASVSGRPRVLIIASDKLDSVGDSYRRTLAPWYDVELVNPTELVPSRFQPFGRSGTTVLTSLTAVAARYIAREPLAFSLPRVLHRAEAFQPDVVVTTFIDLIPPRTIEAIRKRCPRAVILGIYSDAMINFGRAYFFGAEYDALFFKDHYIVNKFRDKLGWKHVWYLPQACDPALHHPVELSETDRSTFGCDLTLAGNTHYYRAAALKPLLGRSMKIWGAGGAKWFDDPIKAHLQGRYVAGEDKCRAMLAAKIVLNSNHFAEIAGTNKRTFEVAAMGAFQLTDTPALSDVFNPDTEVASYTTQADMLEKIEYYLERPDTRLQMAERARIRAISEHTYAHRWVAHLSVLGMSPPADFPVRPEDVRCVPQ